MLFLARPIRCLWFSAGSLLVASAPLLAQSNVWVNPVSGSNSATGTSESDPWRTLKFAVDNVATNGTVHLVPGSYSLASGETFPIAAARPMRILGEGPAAHVVIDATGAGAVAALIVQGNGLVRLSSFTIEGNHEASYLLRTENTVCHAEDVHLNRGLTGIYMWEGATLTFDRSSSSNNVNYGARLRWMNRLIANDSAFSGNGRSGVYCGLIYCCFEDADIELNRCRVNGNGENGVNFNSFHGANNSTVGIHDCLVARNGLSGVRAHNIWPPISVTGCTIAHNGGRGINSQLATIQNTILAMNAAGDAASGTSAVASFSSDGSLSATGGTLSGDPRFVDDANDDFRLRFDSPCVDTGQYLSMNVGLDGYPRAVDGDLDLVAARDIGALEHRTLAGPSAAPAGGPITLYVSGPPGGFSTVIVNHSGYAAAGATNQFGRFFLPASGSFRLTPVVTTGGRPSPVTFDVPADPALIGTSTGFQALTRSSNAPANAAYSNPMLVAIE